MQVFGTELESAPEALQYAEAEGTRAIRLDGSFYTVTRREVTRLECAGVSFGLISESRRHNGQPVLVTVPVN